MPSKQKYSTPRQVRPDGIMSSLQAPKFRTPAARRLFAGSFCHLDSHGRLS